MESATPLRRRGRAPHVFGIACGAMLLFFAFASNAFASAPGPSNKGKVPELKTDDPSLQKCSTTGYAPGTTEFKRESRDDGTFGSGPFAVKLDFSSDGLYLNSWQSNIGVDVVIVKAGDFSNLYRYETATTGEEKSDGHLHGPIRAGSAPPEPHQISHVSFCYDIPATAVQFRSFTARATTKGVLVRWRTGSELDTLGFNVYRAQGGKRVRLNRRLIASKGLTGHAAGGHSYSWRDRSAARRRTARYWLEVVHLDGSRTWHGPIRLRPRARSR